MDKLLFKKWAVPLLLVGLLFGSCINKDYDMDNIDDDMVIQDWSVGAPLGTIEYSAVQIAERAGLSHDMEIDADTLFLRYNRELQLLAAPGSDNQEVHTISVFKDVESDGGILYFSNPIINCTVENKGSALMTFNINSMNGTKENYQDELMLFNGFQNFSISIPENKTVTQRFDRKNTNVHDVFRIGDPNIGVGPDAMVYNFSHTAQSNNDVNAEMMVKLPLTFDKNCKMVVKDTLEMDLSTFSNDYEKYEDNIEYVEIRLNYTNKLPAGGVAEFIFLDKDNALLPLAPRVCDLEKAGLRDVSMPWGDTHKMTQKETEGIMYVIFNKSEWNTAKNIKSMVIKSTLTNPNENIHILPSDFLRFKVDFYLMGDLSLNF